ncbi:MAG: TM2 domain-containing protein [Bacteroidota bacterium]
MGYAAFPIANQKTEMTSVKEGNTSQNLSEQQSQEAVKSFNDATAANATAPAGSGGGKSQVIALILCLLVGGLGIHRFYLGYTWQGVVQLLTGGGCGLWALIDLIRIITGDLKPKDGSYSQTL